MAEGQRQSEDTRRLEAFSDGVFAIAITLLVLDLKVPDPGLLTASLLHTLGYDWPSPFAFVVSFLIIGILWVNHHAMFSAIVRLNRRLLFTNLVLLLFVALLPFPTALVAAYLRAGGPNSHAAAAVYSATMLCVAVSYAAVWIAATAADDRLIPGMDDASVRRSRLRFGAGTVVYLACVGLSFVSAALTLVVHLLVAVYYVRDRLDTSSAGSSGSTQTTAQGALRSRVMTRVTRRSPLRRS